MSRKRVVVAFGTRPEAIKMAAVVHRLREHGGFDVRVLVWSNIARCSTRSFRLFEIEPDADLEVMMPRQSSAGPELPVLGASFPFSTSWHQMRCWSRATRPRRSDRARPSAADARRSRRAGCAPTTCTAPSPKR
jgi:hypothetical protein